MQRTVDAGIFKRNSKAGVDKILANLGFDLGLKYEVRKSGFNSTVTIYQEDYVEPVVEKKPEPVKKAVVKKKAKKAPRGA